MDGDCGSHSEWCPQLEWCLAHIGRKKLAVEGSKILRHAAYCDDPEVPLETELPH